MGNPVDRIRAFNAGRDPVRLAMKYEAMARDAFAFFRGTSHLFWEDWGKRNPLDVAPLAWSTGDLHFENFGTFKGDNRLEYFDINDFDDACLAACVRDPVRGACSLLLAARKAHLPRAARRALASSFLDSYRDVLRDGLVRWVERQTAIGEMRRLLRGVAKRTRKSLLRKRTVILRRDRRRILTDGEHALRATRRDRAWVGSLMRRAQRDGEASAFRILDVARRIAGTGSLGTERYVVLVEGKGSPDRNWLLDLKAAQPSSMARMTKVERIYFPDEAHRIVWIQAHMQAAAPALLRAVKGGTRSYVLRELQPREDRLHVDRLGPRELEEAARDMGRLVGWAQLRSSGRRGAPAAEALQEFAGAAGWRRRLLDYAESYAKQVRRDYKEFRSAWRDRHFAAGGEGSAVLE